jgi:UPF0755 protein
MNCRKATILFVAVGLLLLLCGVLGVTLSAGTTYLAVDQNLGEPSPDLQPLERTLLRFYLMGNASALDRASGTRLEPTEFQVSEGESATEIIQRLAKLDLISNSFLFRNYLRYRGLDVSIESGRYSLSGSMTLREMAATLQRAIPPQTVLVTLEGWRVEQIAEQISVVASLDTAQEFLRAVGTRPVGYSFSASFPDPVWTEGYMFPDTYLLEPEATGDEIARMMLDNFENKVNQDLRLGFEEQGLTLQQGVALASIVEREAIRPEERPLIAGVFLNRLRAGMKLEADPTVQYALGKQEGGEWWKSPLSLDDLETESPFNTYRYPGLPPGPIANPGLDSLIAVAEPEETAFLYFRARCDGSGYHLFATTFEEHLQNACP